MLLCEKKEAGTNAVALFAFYSSSDALAGAMGSAFYFAKVYFGKVYLW